MLTALGLLCLLAVLWCVYHLLEEMFERGGDAQKIMMTLAGLFLTAEAAVASALNTVMRAVLGRGSVMLDLELARTSMVPVFPVIFLLGITWLVWPNRERFWKPLAVMTVACGVSLAVHFS